MTFDFSSYHYRRIALLIAYQGEGYGGFALQTNAPTIEAELFRILHRSRLIIPPSSDLSDPTEYSYYTPTNYSRCGRTDRDVSAYGQVVVLTVRSHFKISEKTTPEKISYENVKDTELLPIDNEMNYTEILNRMLPPSIRVISWAPVCYSFNARHSCTSRTYKYFFFEDSLDIKKMNEAAHYFVGEHDFRNFCKIDPTKPNLSFVRHIFSCSVERLTNTNASNELTINNVCVLTVTASSFLWHQIRCMMTILLSIGSGNENIQVVQSLLDIDKKTSKPQYNLSSPLPLVLFKSEFNPPIKWIDDFKTRERLINDMIETWRLLYMRSFIHYQSWISIMNYSMVKPNAQETEKLTNETNSIKRKFLKRNNQKRNYVPLLERTSEPTLDERINTLGGRKLIQYKLNLEKRRIHFKKEKMDSFSNKNKKIRN